MTGKQKSLMAAVAAACTIAGAMAAEAGEEPAHHRFPADVEAFHRVLAPVWHAAPGRERTRNACLQAERMDGQARDIRSADPSLLLGSIASLRKECRKDQGDVESALSAVHDAFHRLIEARRGA